MRAAGLYQVSPDAFLGGSLSIRVRKKDMVAALAPLGSLGIGTASALASLHHAVSVIPPPPAIGGESYFPIVSSLSMTRDRQKRTASDRPEECGEGSIFWWGRLTPRFPPDETTGAELVHVPFNCNQLQNLTVILAGKQTVQYYNLDANRSGVVATILRATTGVSQLFLGGTLAARAVGRLWALRISVIIMIIGVVIQACTTHMRCSFSAV